MVEVVRSGRFTLSLAVFGRMAGWRVFIGKMEDEVLNREGFVTLREAQMLIGGRKREVNRRTVSRLLGLAASGAIAAR